MFLTRAAAPRSRRLMTVLAAVLLLGVLASPASAAPGWASVSVAQSSTAVDSVVGAGVATFADGSSIVAGFFNGEITVGETTLTSTPTSDGSARDIVVARLDPDGGWVWAVRAGGTGGDEASAVTALPDGSAIVAGSYQGTVVFGATTLTAGVGRSGFVARISANGQWLWATSATLSGTWSGHRVGVGAVSASPDGSAAIVTGTFNRTVDFVTASGTTRLTPTGSRDAFVAKVGSDGVWQWAIGVQGGSGDFLDGEGVAVLTDGSAIVGGRFTGTASFSGLPDLTSTSMGDAFVAKVDRDGAWVWATGAGGSTSSDQLEVYDTAALPDGGAIVTGYLFGSVDVGGTALTTSGPNDFDVFVARIGADGAWVWATRAGAGPAKYAIGMGIAVLTDGSAFSSAVIAGYFAGAVTFGATTLTSDAVQDVFVATIGPTGAWLSATRAGGASSDDDAEALGVALLPDGSAVVTGFMRGSATFGATTLTASGDTDLFVARTGPSSTVLLPEDDGLLQRPASSSGGALGVACAAAPPRVGAVVTCNVSGGDPGAEILWRAAYNPVFAGAGVTLDASGSGTFSFVVPASAVGEELTVELVEWLSPASLGTVGGPVPTSVPSGGGPAQVWSLLLAPVLAGGVVLRRAWSARRAG